MPRKSLFRCRVIVIAVIVCSGLAPSVQSQAIRKNPSQDNYIPSVGDLMGMTQLRHLKLWFAGRLKNWELADYELGQIKASFQEAAAFYPGIPATDITTMAEPIRMIEQAVAQKDSEKFADGFKNLTTACNVCHRGIGRGFIVIQVPTASPFSNQSFAPTTRQ